MENPLLSNFKKIPVPDDFVKALLVPQTAITTDHQMEKFQEKFLNAMGHYHDSERNWKRVFSSCGSTCRHIALLIEQTILLLGQASLSILYTRRLHILKTLLKDLRKAKALLKEKNNLIARRWKFTKTFPSHIIETASSNKRSLKGFKVVMRKVLPFENALYCTKKSKKWGMILLYWENQAIETRTKMFASKTTQVKVSESSVMQIQHQMVNGSSCHQQFRTGSTNKDCNSRTC